MKKITNNYLFNFSASYVGGGYKRLYAYARLFNSRGGAHFIVHPNCRELESEFKNNRYYYLKMSALKRLFNNFKYLNAITSKIRNVRLYYSYGIPIHSKVAEINWFHISNILPLAPEGIPLSLMDQIKMRILGLKIRCNLINADVISAESNYSLSLIKNFFCNKLFLSVNGSDDEISFLKNKKIVKKTNTAVVIGTYKYKSISDSVHIFRMLKKLKNKNLKLIIIGNSKNIPQEFTSDCNIIIKGLLPREDLIGYLMRAKYYISTTYIENSYNAASEGIFLADESYISDIKPHRELLINSTFSSVSIPGISRSILYIKKKDLNPIVLKTWENVFNDMMGKVNQVLHSLSSSPK